MQGYADTNKAFLAQFPKNIIANIAYLVVNIIIGIALTPYFVSTLGVPAYGVIPLATSIIGYIGFIILALNTTVSRYLTVDLQKGDYVAANRTFNTSIFGLFGISALMAPVFIIISFFAPKIFNVPVGQEGSTILLFLCIFAAFLIRAWAGNYTVQLFAYNRLDLQNLLNIINVISTFALYVLFFTLYQPDLIYVGLANVISAVLTSIIAIILAKNVCPHLRISINMIDKSRLIDLSSMSWWLIIDQIGTLLLLQIDLIIVNILFGATLAGEYAIALQWVVLLRSFANMLSSVLTPMVLTYYAKDQIDTVKKMLISSVKMVGLLMALPIGLLCGFAPQVLTLWVGDKFAFLAPLVILLAVHNVINYAVVPLFTVNVAYNRMRVPGVVTLISGFANIILAVTLSLKTGWGFYSVAMAGMIVQTLRNLCFTPWYLNRVIGIKETVVYQSIIPGVISVTLLIGTGLIIGIIIPINSIILLFLIGGSLAVIYFILIWKFALSHFERGLIQSYIPKNIRNFINVVIG